MRRNQNHLINTSNNDKPKKNTTFNYSKNFNRVNELSTDNYKGWKMKILYISPYY